MAAREPTVVAIVGATATGKSDLAVRLGMRLPGEVVNADSMQLYRGMDIGTAKLPLPARRGVAHHVIDVWPVTTEASVAEYQRLARAAIADVAGRGRTPILVGGSGLYVTAVLDDLRFPPTDPGLRAELEAVAQRVGPHELHQRLAVADPTAASLIDVGNVRRVVRALEVIELTGRPFVAALPQPGSRAVTAVHIGLRLDRAALDDAIGRRVDAMFAAGVVSEVESLPQLRGSPTAARALGYAQILAALDPVGAPLPAGVWTSVAAEITRATRRFARRQETWFRRDQRITWFDADAANLEDLVVAHLRERNVAMAS